MKLAALITLLFVHTLYAQDCHERVFGTESYSANHRVSNIVFTQQLTFNQKAVEVLKVFNRNLQCDMTFSAPRCKELWPSRRESRVCYAHSQYGYAIVSRDYDDAYNITFNRWD